MGYTKNRNFYRVPYLQIFAPGRSVMMILNLSKTLAKPLVMAKLNMAYLSSLKNRAKLLSSYLPVSPSRVLRAPGTLWINIHLHISIYNFLLLTQFCNLFIYLFIYLSFPTHSVITIIWHEMYSLKLNVQRYQQVSLLTHFCLASPKWGRQILPKIAKKLRH